MCIGRFMQKQDWQHSPTFTMGMGCGKAAVGMGCGEGVGMDCWGLWELDVKGAVGMGCGGWLWEWVVGRGCVNGM